MKVITGFENTKRNKEDFAVTPYIFGVFVKGECLKVYGFGICWGWYAVFIGFGFGLPKQTPFFRNYT